MKFVVILLCKILRVPMLTQEDIDREENNLINQKENDGYYMVKFNRDDFYYER